MPYPVVRLKPREGRRLRAGAPWVFSNEVAMTAETKALQPGGLVHAVGDDGREFGTFCFNPRSLIALRRFSPAPDAAIDADFFATRLARALKLREAFYDAPFYRLAHAEGDGLPGLTIDRFAETVVVQVTTAGMEALEAEMLAGLDAALAPVNMVLRNDTPARALEGLGSHVRAAKGEMPSRLALDENGTRYFADLARGQKTGWYFDQRENRAFMAALAKGKSVLDAYCYAGGFAVLAAKAGAREVVALDSSAPALALAEEAAAANKVSARTRMVKADVFVELERLAAARETFDIVIADPPPFVKAKKDLETGAKAYRKLARLAASVTAPGGFLLVASCSHNMPADRFASECALGILRTGREAALLRQAGAAPDHPVHPMLPETGYLKALVYALD
ncbi:MAG: class I SAM-dependent rRNA methyltransferase [Alphaproteobacteria bacterium]|nr:class I SAM-dependent rRNA methyltransferase [Alphaproteobacteria bacterium]